MEALSHHLQPMPVEPAEYDNMDEQTRQMLTAIQDGIHLQLKPLELRQSEILSELRQMREHNQKLGTTVALHEERIADIRADLNRGLSAVRKEIEERVASSGRFWMPAMAALAGIVSLLVALVFKFLVS